MTAQIPIVFSIFLFVLFRMLTETQYPGGWRRFGGLVMTMTPLRQRYISDMRLRNLSPRTIDTYTLRVALFARHFGVSPEKLGAEPLRTYQEHLIARGVSWSMFNQAVCALRFLYQITLGRTDAVRHLPFAKRPRNWID